MNSATPAPVALLSRHGRVAVITLNRPEAKNAINGALSLAVGEALDVVDHDPGLAVVVVTGAGSAFSAGADLKAIAAGESLDAPGHEDWGFAGIVHHTIGKPIIAAVNGPALGGGTEIVLACDLAVMSEDAILGIPEVRRGLFAGAGGVVRLPRQVPAKVAMRVALTGDPISAEEAERWGLVNAVTPPGGALDAAMELAESIAANAPLSVRVSKLLVNAASRQTSDRSDEVWALNDAQIAPILASADAMEGPRAFAEKRTPLWTGA